MLTKKIVPVAIQGSKVTAWPISNWSSAWSNQSARKCDNNTMMNMTEILFYFRYDYACFIWSLNSGMTCFPIVCFLVLACFLNLPLTYFRTVLHFYDVFPMHLRQFCNLGTVDPVLRSPSLANLFSQTANFANISIERFSDSFGPNPFRTLKIVFTFIKLLFFEEIHINPHYHYHPTTSS